MILAQRNRRPELVPYTGNKIARAMTGLSADTTQIIKVIDPQDNFYGEFGSYVINVVDGKYAKIILGNEYQLLGPGTHVIHESTNSKLTFDPKTDFIDSNSPFIKHGDITILRVPKGSIAKIWCDNKPDLIEGEAEVIIRDWSYKVDRWEGGLLFIDAATPIIEHSSITRLIPSSGEVFVTRNHGKLEIVDPDKDQLPYKVDSSTYKMAYKLETNTLTLNFPSNKDAVKDEDRYEIFTSKDSLKICAVLMIVINIAEPLVAANKLGDREKIIRHIKNVATGIMGQVMQLSKAGDFLSSVKVKSSEILEGIEALEIKARNKDGKDEKNNSIDLTATSYTIPPAYAPLPSAPDMATPLDIANRLLKNQLAQYGIHLSQLSIEHSKILDDKIRTEMANQAVETAKRVNQVDLLDKDKRIKSTESDILADQKRTESNAQNLRLKNETDAKLARELAEANGRKLVADIDLEIFKAKKIAEREALKEMGKLYESNPYLFQLELEKLSVEKFKGAHLQLFMVPEEMKSIFMANKGMTLFTQKGPQLAMSSSTVETGSTPPQPTLLLEQKPSK
jgi:hypothetical protein